MNKKALIEKMSGVMSAINRILPRLFFTAIWASGTM